MRFANVLGFATAITAAAVPNGKTAVSPDGYVYNVVDESLYIPDTITLEDGTTTTVLVHPAFKRGVAGTTPNDKLDKRLTWNSGGSADKCGASTFVNMSSSGSPKTTDCVLIRKHYQTSGGFFTAWDWDLNGSNWCRLVITNTCVFGIKSNNGLGVEVGALDIHDLTKDAINMFKTSGSPSRIGAEGNMGCSTNLPGGTPSVNWAIFHS
ncbi:putative necrosis-inducing factor-domain-containing protein [Podospora fimiseda]|uniref:Necrosis-inducing factor-domain-containing protein n=1 Tax=Podospora fimiseda TaxID=252190 RepID=A0AAN7BFE0_9PEZI|nr:putative necrosis-inducing factor-domain-containing protein [Podospora fimiseda]